jgi:hypothetical protein
MTAPADVQKHMPACNTIMEIVKAQKHLADAGRAQASMLDASRNVNPADITCHNSQTWTEAPPSHIRTMNAQSTETYRHQWKSTGMSLYLGTPWSLAGKGAARKSKRTYVTRHAVGTIPLNRRTTCTTCSGLLPFDKGHA